MGIVLHFVLDLKSCNPGLIVLQKAAKSENYGITTFWTYQSGVKKSFLD